MTRLFIALMLVALCACGGGDDCREVPCPPTDPLNPNFNTCLECR